MASDLVELNFKNLVRFYSEELRMIKQGERANNIFTMFVKRKLREKGILAYRNRIWVITEDAKMYLSTF